MIAYLISAYTDKEKIKRLIDYLDSKESLFLVHYNKRMPNVWEIKKWLESQKKKNIFWIEPVDVYWSEFSHVQQKMEAIKFLYKNKIKFDYFISLTENDCPIKSNKFIQNFIKKNYNKTFFFNYESNNTKMYYESENGFPKTFKDILRRFYLVNNEIPLDKDIYDKEWKYYLHPRNYINKRAHLKHNLILILNSFWILLFIFFPSKKKFFKSQKFYFRKKIDFDDIKFYSEWQYSITSFFSKKFTDFLYKNHEKYSQYFKKIYAPDESFWITIALNNKDQVGDIVTNWKPLILSSLSYTKSNNNDELYLSWDCYNIDTIKKYSKTNELFCRRLLSNESFYEIIKMVNSNK